MQPFFKLRLACAISTLPTTQAPRRLYYAARAERSGRAVHVCCEM